MKNWIKILSLLIVIFGCFACTNTSKETKNESKKASEYKGIKIVCTTGMVADAVKNIVGDAAKVTALMGPGVDPHLYKATQGDLKKIREADIVVYNGLYLEGKMQDILEKMKSTKPVYAFADAIPKNQLLKSEDEAYAYDPHIWFNTRMWSQSLLSLATKLAKHDEKSGNTYVKNAVNYSNQLNQLHDKIILEISKIPDESRVLITSHDAFRYLERAYNIKVKGLQGMSTGAEFGIKDVSNMVDFIVENKVKAVFIESSVSPKSLNAVVEGCKKKNHKVKIGGKLFSDAMGEAGTAEGTYVGMINHNLKTIVNALQ